MDRTTDLLNIVSNILNVIHKDMDYSKVTDTSDFTSLTELSQNKYIEQEKTKLKLLYKLNIIKQLEKSKINLLNYDEIKIETILESLNNLLVKKSFPKLSKAIGHIIYDAYRVSGYHVILSNIPNVSKRIYTSDLEYITSESIYDTLIHYTGENTIKKVLQVSENIYLAQFYKFTDAFNLCNLINGKMITENIIKAELLVEYFEDMVPEPIVQVVEPVITQVPEQIDTMSNSIIKEDEQKEKKEKVILEDSQLNDIINLDKQQEQLPEPQPPEPQQPQPQRGWIGGFFHRLTHLFGLFGLIA